MQHSYVWGYSQDQYAAVQRNPADAGKAQGSGRTLPATLPTTIEDAITVRSMLELQYIWIDLFCIDQTPSPEQAVQLRNMGNTYRLAAFIIVLTFGQVSQAGMPGVQGYRSNESLPQRRENVAGLELITGLPTLSDQREESKWDTRGWTFQEGLLSTRCLIFGGYELVFYCRAASAVSDRLHSPLRKDS